MTEKYPEPRRRRPFGFFRGLIPRLMSNRAMVGAFELMRKLQRLSRKSYEGARPANEAALAKHRAELQQTGGYVENQHAWTDLRYGKSSMHYSGCEVFAAYNALRGLTGGEAVGLPELIARFEKDGMVLSGRFGTSPKAIADLFRSLGYSARMTTRPEDFDRLAEDSDGLILTLYNDGRDITAQVHTIAVTVSGEGYTAHNAACDGSVPPPCGSLTELIGSLNGGRCKAISLIGIRRPEKSPEEAGR